MATSSTPGLLVREVKPNGRTKGPSRRIHDGARARSRTAEGQGGINEGGRGFLVCVDGFKSAKRERAEFKTRPTKPHDGSQSLKP
jgi:hypothetical protein